MMWTAAVEKGDMIAKFSTLQMRHESVFDEPHAIASPINPELDELTFAGVKVDPLRLPSGVYEAIMELANCVEFEHQN